MIDFRPFCYEAYVIVDSFGFFVIEIVHSPSTTLTYNPIKELQMEVHFKKKMNIADYCVTFSGCKPIVPHPHRLFFLLFQLLR